MFRGSPRALRALLTAAVVGLLAAVPAAAADSTVNVTGIEVKSGNLVGLIASTNGSDIDPSLDVTVAGKTYPVDAITSGTGSPVARTTIIVVDTSGSMGTSGMATVRSAVAAFLKSVPDDVRVGVVSFSGKATLDLAPTADQGKVQAAVNDLTADGETALYDGVNLAVRTLGSRGERSILLLSDGGDTASSATQATTVAALKSAKVRAEAVSFKSTDSNVSVLQSFTKAGGGSVVSAANAGSVQNAFTSAAKTLASQLSFSMPLPAGVGGAQNIKIAGKSGGKAFATTALVDFGAGVAASPTKAAADTSPITGPTEDVIKGGAPAATLPVLGVSPILGLGMGAVFVALMAMVIALSSGSFKSGRTKRVENIDRYVAATAAIGKGKSRPNAVSENLVFLGERMMEGRDSTSKTMAHISRADLPLRAGEWWVLRIVAIVVSVATFMVLFHSGVIAMLVAALIGLLVGVFAPAFILKFLSNRRGKKFEAQLPDVLTLVASSLSTGFSLPQALDAVAKDAADPAAKEFSRALAETRIGSDVSDALERMAARMDSENMRWTSMAIRIQREVGGNLAETLRTTAKTLREREELRRHVRALSAEGRLSAYILVALPIGIFLYTMKTNHDYIQLLWTTTLGIIMIVGGIISLGIGMFWMRKVVDVKV
ncbi:tight adherence protein B [Pedococcus dokdonensis]|uniref:Tight adherence protein B n=1 Tax=Pedococcus dokdonensis TaxID=443156 RepID=A0A1H0R8J9_9MICO|nr:type II secretion system F family protein [Pedococcus dokdonensis]SDP25873.1 tight adherence protein B [Pedococcus dokdonensis]